MGLETKTKTFIAETKNGVKEAIESLDKQVNEFVGSSKDIINTNDTYFGDRITRTLNYRYYFDDSGSGLHH